jgi:hypothetical protein
VSDDVLRQEILNLGLEAGTLLADARPYASTEEIVHDLERVYYVNVDNIVE